MRRRHQVYIFVFLVLLLCFTLIAVAADKEVLYLKSNGLVVAVKQPGSAWGSKEVEGAVFKFDTINVSDSMMTLIDSFGLGPIDETVDSGDFYVDTVILEIKRQP